MTEEGQKNTSTFQSEIKDQLDELRNDLHSLSRIMFKVDMAMENIQSTTNELEYKLRGLDEQVVAAVRKYTDEEVKHLVDRMNVIDMDIEDAKDDARQALETAEEANDLAEDNQIDIGVIESDIENIQENIKTIEEDFIDMSLTS